VRRRSEALTATLHADPTTEVLLADGRNVLAPTGHYIVRRGNQVVTVLPAALLGPGKDYEPLLDQISLTPEQKQRLERTLGLGTTRTTPDLITAVEALATISIGTVRVEFTTGQLAEIAHRAGKRGRTVQAELEAVVDRIKGELFHRVSEVASGGGA
jgi:hypothetical protein